MTKPGTPRPQTDKSQLARFKAAARELECDDDPKAFERVMTKIAKAKPKPQKLK